MYAIVLLTDGTVLIADMIPLHIKMLSFTGAGIPISIEEIISLR